MQARTQAKVRFGQKNSTNSAPSYWLKDKPQRSFSSKPAFGSRPSFAGNRPRGFSGNRSRKKSFIEDIDINKMIQNTSAEITKPIEITHCFADFNLGEIIKKNLSKKGYVTPTPIQDQAIIPIMEGHDLVGLAGTGTGKTAAFLLPLIDKVAKDKSQNVLIIAPTRELAIQIEDEFRQFSWGMQIFSAICVGGSPVFKQVRSMQRKPNFIIGTPGRLKDLAERRIINFGSFENVVIDEVDRMMDMGFIDDIKEMLQMTPHTRQTLFFSATMPPKIKMLISQFSNNPVYVEFAVGMPTKNVNQDVIRVRDRAMKFTQLQEILSGEEVKKALIFIETKIEVDRITSNLISEGFKVESIHGDKRQHQRTRAIQNFQNSSTKILVATDVAARGLDIKGITHVINYTTPQTYDDYVHRVGRAGRGDNKGFAYTFVE
jgi:superfamily II DNA/RNA helicase